MQSKFQRQTLINAAQTNQLEVENFIDDVIEIREDDTFKYLLLTVGGLLMIVSCLMLTNTWVTRKHVNANLDDQVVLQ